MKPQLRSIFRITPNKPFRKVNMLTLKKGDNFYMEEPNGELVCDNSGKFILQAVDNPFKEPPPAYSGIKIDFIA
jgi:hypothetical protein